MYDKVIEVRCAQEDFVPEEGTFFDAVVDALEFSDIPAHLVEKADASEAGDPELALKALATAIKSSLASKKRAPSYTQILNLLATKLGVKNYRTLKGLLDKSAPSADTWPADWPPLSALPADMVLIMEGYPGEENADFPPAARVALNAKLLKVIAGRKDFILKSGCHSTEDLVTIDWADEDSFGIDYERLTVQKEAFYWKAFTRADIAVETKAVTHEEFAALLHKAADTSDPILLARGVPLEFTEYFDE